MKSTILHVDGKWSLFEGRYISPLLDYPRIDSPVFVLSDFDGAISGVSMINSKTSYAESLIGRRLRDDGLIDEEVKILVHHGRQTDSGYQVLYTAVPMNLWQNMQSWAQAQREHCLLIPKTALMYDLLSQENEGVIFRSGRRFSFLLRRRKSMDYFSVLALSDSEDDLRIAARTLAERSGRHQSEGIGQLLRWSWYSLGNADSAEEDIALAKIFKEIAGINVSVAAMERYIKRGGESAYASLAVLQSHFSERLAVNPLTEKVGYFAEKNLTRIGLCTGVVASGLFLWGVVSLLQANIVSARSAQNVSGAQKITQSLQGKAVVAQQNKRFYATRDFIDLATKAQADIDPYGFLRNLRIAAENDVKILRVQIRPEDNNIIVEGWVEQSGGNDKPLATFVEQLKKLGFAPQAVDPLFGSGTKRSGSFAYRLQPISDDERAGI
ncbi:MAG: hypothetical protein LBS40_07165 [Burkholderiales bacterium]|jgi:hypothetical protein|nr:hypothetical protein [Burkholderiales bacterium]